MTVVQNGNNNQKNWKKWFASCGGCGCGSIISLLLLAAVGLGLYAVFFRPPARVVEVREVPVTRVITETIVEEGEEIEVTRIVTEQVEVTRVVEAESQAETPDSTVAIVTTTPEPPDTDDAEPTETIDEEESPSTGDTVRIAITEDGSGSLPFQNFLEHTEEAIRQGIFGADVTGEDGCTSEITSSVFDVYIADVSLGGSHENGFECIRAVVRNNPDVKIVIYAAAERSHVAVQEALSLPATIPGFNGEVDYIEKPDTEALVDKVNQMLGRAE